MPATARQACQIPPLPAEITFNSLKGYAASAAAEILRCDISRQTAVDVHDGEHADEDAWLKETSPRGIGIGSIVGGS